MPIYTIHDTKTNNIFDVNMKYVELEEYLLANPDARHILGVAAICDSARIGVKRVDDNFKDVLKKAKGAHLHSTVNTF